MTKVLTGMLMAEAIGRGQVGLSTTVAEIRPDLTNTKVADVTLRELCTHTSRCRVDVTPGKGPTFVRGGKGEADRYVRVNNVTRLLNSAEALEYVQSRWR